MMRVFQSSTSPPRSVLVIDESTSIRLFVCQNLMRRGYDVREVPSLDSHQWHFADWQPDTVLTEMPVYKAVWQPWLSELSTISALSRTPVIVLATWRYPLEELKRENPNVAAMLIKPFSAQDLMITVHEVLRVGEDSQI